MTRRARYTIAAILLIVTLGIAVAVVLAYVEDVFEPDHNL